MPPVEAYENFIFAKEEFLNGISIVSAFLIASTSEKFHTFYLIYDLITDLCGG